VRDYEHLRLDPWRPPALILDEEVSGEVAHAFAVSSMRGRRRLRLRTIIKADERVF
jgi:hypothetical protein